jgi:NAD(P)-dependent dehydrogenase (short-subunit alcohol dehydrogenase family)
MIDSSTARGVAVVTGAGGAIGASVARRLCKDGFTVACVDLQLDAAERTAAALPSAAGFRTDVRLETEVQDLREAIEGRLGSPWLLVNAAGVFFEHLIPDLSEEGWDFIIDVNLKGTFLTCKSFLPAMIENRSGCIVNVGSTLGIRGARSRPAYCASKGGVVMLTRALALDHAPDGVRVNCVCPGVVDTPMAEWLTSDPASFDAWRSTVPANRIGMPDDVAGAVSYLASPDADYVHGAMLVVDGAATV